jgi:hypothetical protein
MAYTETTTTSYGQRLSGSFKGIGSGILMFILGTILLFWNEGNFVKTQKALEEAQGVTEHVDDVSTVDASLNGKLIHASAFANTEEVLTDDLFGVSVTAVHLERTVEYYQWEEESKSKTHDKIGGGQETVTTYTYKKGWTDSPVESSSFKDVEYQESNFVLANVEDKTQLATNVTFGGYQLPAFIISSISGDVPAEPQPTAEQLAEWQRMLENNLTAMGIRSAGDTLSLIHVIGNTGYLGASPNRPKVGDLRVTLTKVLPADISIIAKVKGQTFEKYTAKNGKSVSEVTMGTASAEEMFAGAHDSNSFFTWAMRILGLILVIGGLKSMFSILPTLFKVLPFLGNIVEAGVGLVCSVGGFVWSLLIIAISWLWYRPFIGITLLVIVVGGIVYLKKVSKSKKFTKISQTCEAKEIQHGPETKVEH